MKKFLLLAFLCTSAMAQSPYSLTPQWRFGAEGGLNFPSGSFPTSGAPVATPASDNPTAGVYPEGSTSISSRNGTVAVYTNTVTAFNSNNANIRSFAADNVCSGSATSGGIAIPDPADPDNAYYVILANDLTGGSCGSKGLNRYRFLKNAGVAAYNSGPTNMAANSAVSEALTAGTDGAGGYWIVSHVYTNSNTFKVWNINAAGVISGPVDYTVGAATPEVSINQSYIKLSPCQDMVAYTGAGVLVVHAFNRATGVVGAELRRINTGIHGVGLEFSPDGSKIYYSGQGSVVGWCDIATGTIGSLTGSSSWTLQLGPDGKIYTSPGGSALVGVISSPNSSPTYNTISTNGYLFRGISNIAWLSPQRPVITATATATCNVYDFSFVFRNYFNDNIALNASSVSWDWGDGSTATANNLTPTHTFPASSGSYTVTLTFRDATCNQTWQATIDVTVTCPAPVELISFNGVANPSGVDLIWKTSMELNNDYFDLQRSADGINFYSIAQIKGAGTSNKILNYTYRDEEITSGLVYYRLVQHDFDGTMSYSKIVVVRFDKVSSAPVLVAPNPFSSSFVLSKIYDEEATVTVYDVYGRILEQKSTTAEETTLVLGEFLANGSYIVQYLTSNNSYTVHVEKK